jgi:hypothetical protein
MAINLATLKTEIATAPYAGLDEVATAALLNAKTIAADVDASQETILRAFVARKIFGKLVARIEVVKARIEARLVTLINAVRAFETLPSFQTATPAINTFVGNMLDDLVAEGALIAGDKTAMMNVTRGNISRAEQLFARGDVVTSGDVSRAKVS